ncbi:MAG: hypothetical protein IPJ07_23385 [Acidobacteria bacterium]|nr:hypothetical protein [Acidobacteriota bacterium]
MWDPAFNARKYKDQVTNTNFIDQNITTSGIRLNPAGRVATQEEVASAPKDFLGNPVGFRNIFLTGESRNYDFVHFSAERQFLSDLRSSMGLEFHIRCR